MSDSPDWPLGNGRQLRAGPAGGGVDRRRGRRAGELVYTSDTVLLEAPNWAPDGQALLLNGDGRLWRLDLRRRRR